MKNIGKIFVISFTTWFLTAVCSGVLLGTILTATTHFSKLGEYMFCAGGITGILSMPFIFAFFIILSIASPWCSARQLYQLAIGITFFLLVVALAIFQDLFDYERSISHLVFFACLFAASYTSLFLHFKCFKDIKN